MSQLVRLPAGCHSDVTCTLELDAAWPQARLVRRLEGGQSRDLRVYPRRAEGLPQAPVWQPLALSLLSLWTNITSL